MYCLYGQIDNRSNHAMIGMEVTYLILSLNFLKQTFICLWRERDETTISVALFLTLHYISMPFENR